jgi:hypothetical protein
VDFYSPLFARIIGSVLDAAGEEEAALSVLDEGLVEANERDDVYEAALIIETIERIDDRHLDGKSVQAARETLRTLGVRSVPGFSIVDD